MSKPEMFTPEFFDALTKATEAYAAFQKAWTEMVAMANGTAERIAASSALVQYTTINGVDYTFTQYNDTEYAVLTAGDGATRRVVGMYEKLEDVRYHVRGADPEEYEIGYKRKGEDTWKVLRQR